MLQLHVACCMLQVASCMCISVFFLSTTCTQTTTNTHAHPTDKNNRHYNAHCMSRWNMPLSSVAVMEGTGPSTDTPTALTPATPPPPLNRCSELPFCQITTLLLDPSCWAIDTTHRAAIERAAAVVAGRAGAAAALLVCACACAYACTCRAASRGSGSADKTLSPTGTDMFIASAQFPCDGDRDARDDQLTPRLPLTVHTDASAAVTSCAAPTTYRRRNPPELVAPPLHRCQPRDGFEEEVGQRCEQKITWFLESIVGPSAHASNTSCE